MNLSYTYICFSIENTLRYLNILYSALFYKNELRCKFKLTHHGREVRGAALDDELREAHVSLGHPRAAHVHQDRDLLARLCPLNPFEPEDQQLHVFFPLFFLKLASLHVH